MREQSNTNTLRLNSPHAFSWVPFSGRRNLRMTRRLHCNHHCPCGDKALHANGATSRLAAVVRWFRYPSFKRKSMPFRSVYSADNNAWLTRFPDSQAVRGFP